MIPTKQQERAINSAQGRIPRLLTKLFPRKKLRKILLEYIEEGDSYSQNPDKIGIFSIRYKPWEETHKERGEDITVQLMIPKGLSTFYEQLTGKPISQNPNRFLNASGILDILSENQPTDSLTNKMGIMRVREVDYKNQKIGFVKDPREVIEIEGYVGGFLATLPDSYDLEDVS